MYGKLTKERVKFDARAILELLLTTFVILFRNFVLIFVQPSTELLARCVRLSNILHIVDHHTHRISLGFVIRHAKIRKCAGFRHEASWMSLDQIAIVQLTDVWCTTPRNLLLLGGAVKPPHRELRRFRDATRVITDISTQDTKT